MDDGRWQSAIVALAVTAAPAQIGERLRTEGQARRASERLQALQREAATSPRRNARCSPISDGSKSSATSRPNS